MADVQEASGFGGFLGAWLIIQLLFASRGIW